MPDLRKNRGRRKEEEKKSEPMYSLSDAFAVPATFVGVILADRVRQRAVEDAGPEDARQEVNQLLVQLVQQVVLRVRRRRRSCVHLAARRRGRFRSCIRGHWAFFVGRQQLRAAAHLSHLKKVKGIDLALLRMHGSPTKDTHGLAILLLPN